MFGLFDDPLGECNVIENIFQIQIFFIGRSCLAFLTTRWVSVTNAHTLRVCNKTHFSDKDIFQWKLGECNERTHAVCVVKRVCMHACVCNACACVKRVYMCVYVCICVYMCVYCVCFHKVRACECAHAFLL